MTAGGNDLCNEYLENLGIVIDCMTGDRQEIRPKYSGSEAASYRELLAARVAAGDGAAGSTVTPSFDSQTSAHYDVASAPTGASLGDNGIIPPSPSDYYPLVYHILVGRKGISPPVFGGIVAGTGALAMKFLPQVFPRSNTNTIRLICAAVVGLPLAVVGGMVWKLSRQLVLNRQEAYNSARNGLLERIKMGRASRKRGYDLFIPDLSKSKSNEVDFGLILLPGALVDHTAYAVIASKLSDQGILVAVMNMEPCRLPMNQSGASKIEVLKIMYDVIGADGNDAGVAAVKEWAIGGHSMGAFQAFELCSELRPGISKLIMWGMGRAFHLPDNTLADADVDAVIIVGSEDTYCKKMSTADRHKFEQVLPQNRTTFVQIRGGNHAGFAHYGPQTFPIPDGVRAVTLEEQQDAVAKATAGFLRGKIGPKAKKE